MIIRERKVEEERKIREKEKTGGLNKVEPATPGPPAGIFFFLLLHTGGPFYAPPHTGDTFCTFPHRIHIWHLSPHRRYFATTTPLPKGGGGVRGHKS